MAGLVADLLVVDADSPMTERNDLFPRRLLAIGVAVGLIEMVVGTLAGAYLYKEAEKADAAPKARTAAAS